MSNLEISHDFEELQLPAYGLGATFTGMANLIECGDTFRVKDIRLGWRDKAGKWVDGAWLQEPPYDHGGTFEQRMFKQIADVLERDIDVQQAWADAWNELRYDQSEPAAYSAMEVA